MPSDEKTQAPPPSAITLDERINAILGANGDHTVANLTREELTQKIAALRAERAENKMPTLDGTGVVLKKCPRVKARKNPHKHLCVCGTEYDCAVGAGCIWNKHVPACAKCNPECSADFAETWNGREEEESDDATGE